MRSLGRIEEDKRYEGFDQGEQEHRQIRDSRGQQMRAGGWDIRVSNDMQIWNDRMWIRCIIMLNASIELSIRKENIKSQTVCEMEREFLIRQT